MSKCPELFHKFKVYSESCGLGNPKDMERHISIAEEISEEFDINVDKIYLLFPMTASKKLAKYPKDSEIRKNVTKKIADAINNNIRVTSKTIEIWLHDEGVPLQFTTVSPAKIAKKVSLVPPSVQRTDLKSRNAAIKSALTSGQYNILLDVMTDYGPEDETAAIAMVLIWAKEKMENDRK